MICLPTRVYAVHPMYSGIALRLGCASHVRTRGPRYAARLGSRSIRLDTRRLASASRVARPDQFTERSPQGADEVGATPAYQTAAAPPATSLSIDVDASSRERWCDEASHHQDTSVTAQRHRGVAGPRDAHRSC